MKKLFFGGLLLGSIGLNIYLINTEVVVQNDLDEDNFPINDEITIAQSAVKKSAKASSQHIQNIKNIKNDLMPKYKASEKNESEYTEEKTPDNYDNQYELEKDAWEDKVTTFMEVDLGLEPNNVDKYFRLVEEREKAISDYIKPKIDENSGKTYLFTLEDNIAIGKINEKYLKRLKNEIGNEAYEGYVKFRKSHNQNLMEGRGHTYFVEF